MLPLLMEQSWQRNKDTLTPPVQKIQRFPRVVHRPIPSSDFLGGVFDLICRRMKTRQGNWGLAPQNFEIHAVLAAWKSGPLRSWRGSYDWSDPHPPGYRPGSVAQLVYLWAVRDGRVVPLLLWECETSLRRCSIFLNCKFNAMMWIHG